MLEKIKNFLNQTISHQVLVALVFFITIPLGVFGFWYQYKTMSALSQRVTSLSNNLDHMSANLASTTLALEQNIHNTQTSFQETLTKEKGALESKISSVQSEVGTVSGTVTTLEKLSKTDPELLQKYSKVFFLNENYAPSRLVEIPEGYRYYSDKELQFYDRAWPYLENMLKAAKSDGVDLYVYSAYRSFDTQSALKGQYTVVYGAGTANQFSADQGYSEHQLGTTVDLITTGIGGTLAGFDGTTAYQWLTDNAYKFGFVLSYPKDNSYYIYEPWHWRFVGVGLATYLKTQNKYFYDLDQRQIDEYLVSIFD